MAHTARKETGFLLLWLIFFPAFLRLLFHAINYGTAAAELSSVRDAKEEEPCVPRNIVETFSEGPFDYIYLHAHFGLHRLTFSNSLICISCHIIRVTINGLGLNQDFCNF